MKIPKTIDILGSIYQVIQTLNIEEDIKDIVPKSNHKDDDKEYLGYFDATQQKIWINAKLKPRQQERTLIHEVIEVLNVDLALNLSHDNIDRLEHGIYYTLTKNNFLKE